MCETNLAIRGPDLLRCLVKVLRKDIKLRPERHFDSGQRQNALKLDLKADVPTDVVVARVASQIGFTGDLSIELRVI